MILGQINYLNLLPFNIFIKRSYLQSYAKKSINHKKALPSELNKAMKFARLDAAVISSFHSQKYINLNFGIVAKKEVTSVLVKKNTKNKDDPASASSNALAKILNIKGEVIIGDRALKLYLKDPNSYYDLAQIWHKKTNLPFVFGLFCARKNQDIFKDLIKAFFKQKSKIPSYILNSYCKNLDLSKKEILDYLSLISYKIGIKEKKALRIFLFKSKLLKK